MALLLAPPVLLRPEGLRPHELLPPPPRRVDRRDRLEGRPVRPRPFLAMMISSKSRISGSEVSFISLSWTNSLNAIEKGNVSLSDKERLQHEKLTLCLPHHCDIFLLIVRETLDESIHVKGIQLATVFVLL